MSAPVPARWAEGDPVRINYPKAPYRNARVRLDDGGPKVKVRWRGEDGPKVGRHVVAWYGQEHEQWIPRERLTRPGPLSVEDMARLDALFGRNAR